MSSKRESEDERFERLGYKRVLDANGKPTPTWVGPNGDLVSSWFPRKTDEPVLDFVAGQLVLDGRESNDCSRFVKFRYRFAAGDDANPTA